MPIALYVINLMVRLVKGFPVTAAADWALLLFGVDIVALISVKDFSVYVPVDAQEFASVLFAGLMLFGLMIWLLNILWGEGVLERVKTSGWTFVSCFYVVLSISLTVIYIYGHLLVFSGRLDA